MDSPTPAYDSCGGELSSAFKRLGPMVTGATMGEQQDPPTQVTKTSDVRESPPLVGPRNEGEVEVNGMKCTY